MRDLGDLVIREVQAEDEESILSLLRLTLGPGSAPRTREFWRWKHQRSPFGPSPMLVAMDGDEAVGLRAFLRWRWRLGGRTVTAVRPVDTAVHPAWQRLGLFSRLTRSLLERVAEEGVELVFNTPNRRSGKGYRKLGWRRAGRPRLALRPRRPVRMLTAPLRLGGRPRAAEIEGHPPVSELLDWPGLPELLRTEAEEREGRLSTARDRAYLRWRYAGVPTLDYRAHWEAEAGSSAAIVFRSRVRRSMREILIAEILARGSLDGRRRLVRRLLDRATAASDVDYALAIAPPASAARLSLGGTGLRTVPWGPTLMTRCLSSDPRLESALDAASWQLAAGDLEIF